MELIMRCQRANSNEYLSWCQKELILRHKPKRRGIPEKESPGILIPKGDTSWRQNEINSEVPEGQFLRSVQFLRISELAPKGNNSEVPAGEFAPAGKFLRSVQFLRRFELAPKGNNYEVPAGYFRASGTIST